MGWVLGARRRVVGRAVRASKQSRAKLWIRGIPRGCWAEMAVRFLPLSLSRSFVIEWSRASNAEMLVTCILCVSVVGLPQPFSLSRETRAPRGDTRCCYCGRGLQPAVQHAMCSREAFQRFFSLTVFMRVKLLGSCWVGAVLGSAGR